MLKRCQLSTCKKPFPSKVPWQKYCSKPCTDKASQQKRAKLMKAGLRAMKGLGVA